MLKKNFIILIALIAVIFGIFSLSTEVEAKADFRAFKFKYVCCGPDCGFDHCLEVGVYNCCIPKT
jgi:hypothetical protein